jgi:hypothetical protein
MLTDLDGRGTDRHDNSHDRVSRNRQMHQRKVPLRGDRPAGQRHLAAEAGVSEAGAEGLAYRFLCRPEVQECLEFFGLAGQPGELGGGEPAVSQGGDVSGVAVFEVYADWARQTGDDCDEAVGVTEAHPERVDVGSADGVVPQYGGAPEAGGSEQGAGEFEEQGVGSRPLVAFDGLQPDVHGGQIGARTLNHRKKVSR